LKHKRTIGDLPPGVNIKFIPGVIASNSPGISRGSPFPLLKKKRVGFSFATQFFRFHNSELTKTIITVCVDRDAMPTMMVHHQVSDFAKWKPFFDRDETRRKSGGSKGSQVFQNHENPNDVFILFEWDTLENAKKFGTSADLKKIMEQAGVTGQPHIHFLQEVQKGKA